MAVPSMLWIGCVYFYGEKIFPVGDDFGGGRSFANLQLNCMPEEASAHPKIFPVTNFVIKL